MTELRAFRRACYDAAQRTGGNVVEFRVAEGMAPNFHQGIIVYGDQQVAVAALAASPGFAVLTAADLNGPFVATAWPGIERSDIEYWTPQTVGEALFHYWD